MTNVEQMKGQADKKHAMKKKPQSKAQNTKGALLTKHSKFHPACRDGRVHCPTNAGNVTVQGLSGDDGHEVGLTGESFVNGNNRGTARASWKRGISQVPRNLELKKSTKYQIHSIYFIKISNLQ